MRAISKPDGAKAFEMIAGMDEEIDLIRMAARALTVVALAVEDEDKGPLDKDLVVASMRSHVDHLSRLTDSLSAKRAAAWDATHGFQFPRIVSQLA